jgi:hypothetical protein
MGIVSAFRGLLKAFTEANQDGSDEPERLVDFNKDSELYWFFRRDATFHNDDQDPAKDRDAPKPGGPE